MTENTCTGVYAPCYACETLLPDDELTWFEETRRFYCDACLADTTIKETPLVAIRMFPSRCILCGVIGKHLCVAD